jgi:hypothetical protein
MLPSLPSDGGRPSRPAPRHGQSAAKVQLEFERRDAGACDRLRTAFGFFCPPVAAGVGRIERAALAVYLALGLESFCGVGEGAAQVVWGQGKYKVKIALTPTLSR